MCVQLPVLRGPGQGGSGRPPPPAGAAPQAQDAQSLCSGTKGGTGCPWQLAPQRGATGSLIQGPFSFRCSGKTWCLQALIAREAEGQERALRLTAALGGVTEHLL